MIQPEFQVREGLERHPTAPPEPNWLVKNDCTGIVQRVWLVPVIPKDLAQTGTGLMAVFCDLKGQPIPPYITHIWRPGAGDWKAVT